MGFVVQFDARQVQPNIIPEPVPTGIYTVAIVKSEEVAVKNNPGATYYQFTMQILEGEHKGRTVVDRLNCKNPNQQTVDIAYGTLSSICHVTGVLTLNRSEELHGKPFKVNVVKVQRQDDPARSSNDVRGYLNMDGSEPGKQGQAPAATAGTPSFSTGTPIPTASAFAPQSATPLEQPPAPAVQPFNNGGPVVPPQQSTAAPQSVPAQPAVPTPPAPITEQPTFAAPPPPAPVTFPPAGWAAHPSAPGFFYKDQEVLSEAQLRELSAAPAAPTTPVAPPAPTNGAPAATAAPASPTPATPSWAQ